MKQKSLNFRKAITAGMDSTQPSAIEEMEALKNELLQMISILMMSFGKKGNSRSLMCFLQKDVVWFLNALYHKEQETELNEFCMKAKACLTEILTSLQRYDNYYFDLNLPTPLYLMKEVGTGMEGKLLKIKAAWKSKKISAELQEIVLDPYVAFQKMEACSYRRMEYLLNLMEQLPLATSDTALLDLLLEKDFNSTAFLEYYQLKIAAEVISIYQVNGQFDRLHYYEKKFAILAKNHKGNYDPDSTSCKVALLNFVQVELSYLQKQHPKADVAFVPGVLPGTAPAYKIKTNLSVDGLAYLVRLLIEAEAIEANPRTELLAFLAAHVQTQRTGSTQISTNSLNTKYKQITQATATSIKALLVKMTNEVDREYLRR